MGPDHPVIGSAGLSTRSPTVIQQVVMSMDLVVSDAVLSMQYDGIDLYVL